MSRLLALTRQWSKLAAAGRLLASHQSLPTSVISTSSSSSNRGGLQGVLDTPEEKKVYPGLKQLGEAAKKQQRRESDAGTGVIEDASEPSNVRLEAARRYDNAYSVAMATGVAATASPSMTAPDGPATVTAAVLEAAAAAGLAVSPSLDSDNVNAAAWRDVSLADPAQKFALLTGCIRRLAGAAAIANSRLAELATLGDVADHFLRPPEQPADPLKRLAASPDLPANVHVQIEPLRFGDNPAFFDGADAFPGRDTLVTQPWARLRYRSKIAPPLRSPRWSGVGRNPGSLADIMNRQ